MHSMFFTPKKLAQDEHWGQNVVSLVNSTLDLKMEYHSPILPSHRQEESRTIAGTILFPDHFDASISSYQRADDRQNPADKKSNRGRDRKYHLQSLKHDMDVENSTQRRSRCVRRPVDGIIERQALSNLTGHTSHATQQNSQSLRMPDFFKRVFAPPTCLFPDVDYDRVDGERWPTRSLQEPSHSQQFAITEAIFSKRQPSRTYPITKPRKARQVLPWTSTNTMERICPISSSQQQYGNRIEGAEHADRREESPFSIQSNTNVLNISESHYSSYSSVNHEIRDRISLDGSETCRSRQIKPVSPQGNEIHVASKVQEFLNTPLVLQPLDAAQILQLCEGTDSLTGSRVQTEIITAVRGIDASQHTKRCAEAVFAPRRTIGKTHTYIGSNTSLVV